MSHPRTSVSPSRSVGSDSRSLLSFAARATVGHGESCCEITVGWLSLAWIGFDSLVGVLGCITKILSQSTEDWSTSLWFQALVLTAGIAALHSHWQHVWPPTFSGGGGGHRSGQSELGHQKYDGFAGALCNGPVRLEFHWTITGTLSDGTGQGCVCSVSSSGFLRDTKRHLWDLWSFFSGAQTVHCF